MLLDELPQFLAERDAAFGVFQSEVLAFDDRHSPPLRPSLDPFPARLLRKRCRPRQHFSTDDPASYLVSSRVISSKSKVPEFFARVQIDSVTLAVPSGRSKVSPFTGVQGQ